MSDLIKSIPDGWKNEQGFVKKPSRLSPGQLVDLKDISTLSRPHGI